LFEMLRAALKMSPIAAARGDPLDAGTCAYFCWVPIRSFNLGFGASVCLVI